MREIKFRAWDMNDKKMFRFDKLLYCAEYNLLSWRLKKEDRDPNGGDYCNLSGMESFEVMQYTGLKDKNGKDIYEGDILNNGDIVQWDDDKTGFTPFSIIAQSRSEKLEVIGNIHENQELLQPKI